MSRKRIIRCDLHIHSCLSPCSDLLMTPGNIVRRALTLGLDCIAITDHNTAGNVQVAMDLAQNSGLTLIPAMEVETREEIHLLCFFPTLDKTFEFDEIVARHLPEASNDEEVIGYQLLTNSNDEYIAKDPRLLATATNLTLTEMVVKVTELGGTMIPSHVDRRANSIIGQLGFMPSGLGLAKIEISKNTVPEFFLNKYPSLKGFSYITGSDSHYLGDLGKCGQGHFGFPFPTDLSWLLGGNA